MQIYGWYLHDLVVGRSLNVNVFVLDIPVFPILYEIYISH